MARYAQAVAQVDAAHALRLQNAQRYALRACAEVGPATSAPGARRDQAFTAQTCSQRRSTCCTRSAAAAACSKSSDFQRLWRDTNAASAHHGLTWDWVAVAWTKEILGLPTPPGFVFTRS